MGNTFLSRKQAISQFCSDNKDKIIVRSFCYSILGLGIIGGPTSVLPLTELIGCAGIFGSMTFLWSYFTTWLAKKTSDATLGFEIAFGLAIILFSLKSQTTK